MFDKKAVSYKSPDMSKLQEVIIDLRTKIYIAIDADADEARSRYATRIEAKNKSFFATRKPNS